MGAIYRFILQSRSHLYPGSHLLILTRELLTSTRADGFAFIRKIKSVDDDAMQELKSIYSSF